MEWAKEEPIISWCTSKCKIGSRNFNLRGVLGLGRYAPLTAIQVQLMYFSKGLAITMYRRYVALPIMATITHF